MRSKSSLAVENVFFPEDILMDILSYVEAKYLLRCKSVCKLWYDVIGSKQLVEMHLMRNGHRYYDMHVTFESLNSEGIVEKTSHICHRCRGLVLLGFSTVSSSVNFGIYNPTTKFSINLPHLNYYVRSIHVFLNTFTGSYNVLSVCYDEKKKTRHIKILDLGGQSNDPYPDTDLSWTTLKIPEFENASTHEICHSMYLMSSEGNILYILSSPYVGSTKLKITCVDIVKLTCTTLDMPVNFSSLWIQIGLNFSSLWIQIGFGFWRGMPSVVFILEDKLNILALEDYKTQRWADTMVFPLPYPKDQILNPRIYTDGTEDILYCSSIRYSPRCRVYKLESKVSCDIPSFPRKVPATLVSVKGMQPQKKESRIKLKGMQTQKKKPRRG